MQPWRLAILTGLLWLAQAPLFNTIAWADELDGIDATIPTEPESLPPTMNETAPPATIDTEPDHSYTGGGLFGDLRIGPTLLLGFPHPLSAGLDLTWDHYVGGGFTVGNFNTKSGSAKVAISNWDIRGRWFMLGSNFFVGAAYGRQTVKAKASEDITASGQTVATDLNLQIDTTYFTPHLGWFTIYQTGLTLGFEVGYQMPLSSQAKDLEFSTGDAAKDALVKGSSDFQSKAQEIQDNAEKLGKKPLPYITLLRVGWML